MSFNDFLIQRILTINVIHSIPGRFRLHLPHAKEIPIEWQVGQNLLDSAILIDGIQKIEFNYKTANAVITYDISKISQAYILNLFSEMFKIAVKHKHELERFEPSEAESALHFLMTLWLPIIERGKP